MIVNIVADNLHVYWWEIYFCRFKGLIVTLL